MQPFPVFNFHLYENSEYVPELLISIPDHILQRFKSYFLKHLVKNVCFFVFLLQDHSYANYDSAELTSTPSLLGGIPPLEDKTTAL